MNGENSGNDIICTSSFYKLFIKVSGKGGVNASHIKHTNA